MKPDFLNDDLRYGHDLIERITLRVSPRDRELIEDAAEVLRVEVSRMIRRIVLKTLRELEPEIEKRRSQLPPLPF